ncbi:hypothetical protein AB1283_01005 [Bacillus sp. S13(2024)]|uniref:hypothetical protein n=1 Tax=Bacillus sp. S13(2024) TaxID=3162885 RepID=UPI003D200726
MNLEKVNEQIENAMEDKQEFADLCFKLVPQLIKEIENLQQRSEFLGYLEACGVDNWDGYSDAWEMMNEEEYIDYIK